MELPEVVLVGLKTSLVVKQLINKFKLKTAYTKINKIKGTPKIKMQNKLQCTEIRKIAAILYRFVKKEKN